MEIFGLPAHVLIVHAAVVFAPLAALSAIVFAVVPKWRYLTRLPTVVLAVVGTAAIWAARFSGISFRNQRLKHGAITQDLIQTHQTRGLTLSWIMLVFLVVALVAARLLSGPSGLVSGKGAVAVTQPWAEKVLPALLVLVSVLALVWVVLTGDAGARTVWG